MESGHYLDEGGGDFLDLGDVLGLDLGEFWWF